jgi:hypothetical protein
MIKKSFDPVPVDIRDFPHWIAASLELVKRHPFGFIVSFLIFIFLSVALHRHIGLFTFGAGLLLQVFYLWITVLLAWCSDYSVVLFSTANLRRFSGLVFPALVLTILSLLTILAFSLLTRYLLTDETVYRAATVTQLIKPRNWWEFSVLMSQVQLFVLLTCCLFFQQLFLVPLKGILELDTLTSAGLSLAAQRINIDLSIALVLVMLTIFVLIWLLQAYAAAVSLIIQPASGLLLYILFREIFLHRKDNLPEAIPHASSVAASS